MQPNNLTALNYDEIKASIKSYLRTRDEFSDYDFEGSTLSYLIDILAYNTYYSAFTANMLITAQKVGREAPTVALAWNGRFSLLMLACFSVAAALGTFFWS